jgi:hypothetical protein
MTRLAAAFIVLLVVGGVERSRGAADADPLEIAKTLAARYPDAPLMSYIPALAWSGSMRLATLTGEAHRKERATQQMLPFVSGATPSIAEPYLLTSLAGHLAFADAGHAELARRAADFILPTVDGEIVRFARGWTDDMFMATSLLARVAETSTDQRYVRAVGRLLTTYAAKLQRTDGLYLHAADGPHAWGRGNGFAAFGMMEALTHLPAEWPERTTVLESFRRQMRAFLTHQADDGSWRQVVDEPTSYRELTVTAMTVAAMARGVRLGWLDGKYRSAIDRGWAAVAARTNQDGSVRDVCSGTGAGPTKEYYLTRPVINGADDRGGALALTAALEVVELRRKE